MYKIFNGTPHAINIVAKNSCRFDSGLRKWVSESPIILVSVPPSGKVLSAKITTAEAESKNGIPVFDKKIEGYDPLPDADIIIVSALYASALQKAKADTSRVYTVADPVYSLDGKTILGSLGICPAF